MTVMQRDGSPKWQIEFTYRDVGVRKTSGILVGETKAEQKISKAKAEAIEAEWKAAIDVQKDSKHTQVTLFQALERHAETGVKARNRVTFLSSINRLCGAFGKDTLLDDIREEQIHEWRDAMMKGGVMVMTSDGWKPNGKPMAVASVNKYLKVLKRVLRRSHYEFKVLREVPHIVMAKDLDEDGADDEGEVRFLGDAEEAVLLGAAKDHPHVMNLLRFLIDCGGRKTESLNLTWDKLDLQGDASVRFYKNTKGNKKRTVPLSDDVRDMLVAMRKAQLAGGYTGNYVFAYKNQYGAWQDLVDVKAFVRVREVAMKTMPSLVDVSLHTCRHTFASRLVQAEVPLIKVRDLLGHSSVKMTEVYAHLAPTSLDTVRAIKAARKAKVAAELPALLGHNGGPAMEAA